MGGRLSRPVFVGQDREGRWRKECAALEDRLGFTPGEIYRTWSFVALMREAESVAPLPRDACEEMALLNVIEMFDKVGSCGC